MTAAPSDDPLTLELGNAFAAVSGNMMMTLLEQSQDCVKVIDTEGRLGFMNRNGRCSMEVDDFRTIDGALWWDLWPAESQDTVRRALFDAVAGSESRFEAMCPTAKGNQKWWDVTVSPVRDNNGEIFRIVSFSRDVTEQVKAREAMETMAFEMRHRLRNAFAVSGAIATISAKDRPEHAQFARELSGRYNSLAAAQTQMLENSATTLSLADLLKVMIAPYQSIECNCPAEIEVSDRVAKVVALAIGELATNSVKYGAVRDGSGIRISAVLNDGKMTLTWHEPGVAHSTMSGGGQGYGLINRMAQIYGGSFAAEWPAEGLEAHLILPR